MADRISPAQVADRLELVRSWVVKVKDGSGLILGKPTVTPDTGDDLRGLLYRTEGAAGVTHTVRLHLKNSSDTEVAYYPLLSTSSNLALSAGQITGVPFALHTVIDGGGVAITTGIKPGAVYVPYAHTITGVYGMADQSGSIIVDIWRRAFGSYPPTNTQSITASAPLTLSSAAKASDTTLTGWSVNGSAGDVYFFNVDSNPATSITWLAIALTLTRTI